MTLRKWFLPNQKGAHSRFTPPNVIVPRDGLVGSHPYATTTNYNKLRFREPTNY
jgi:hypothetical protein